MTEQVCSSLGGKTDLETGAAGDVLPSWASVLLLGPGMTWGQALLSGQVSGQGSNWRGMECKELCCVCAFTREMLLERHSLPTTLERQSRSLWGQVMGVA